MKGTTLTENDVSRIEFLIEKGLSDKEIGIATGFSFRTAQRVRKGIHVLQLKAKEVAKAKVKEETARSNAKNTTDDETKLQTNFNLVKQMLLNVCSVLEESQKLISERSEK